MSNRAYLRVWCRGVAAEQLPELLRQFLETVPYSRVRPGCTRMTARAVDPSETPMMERDLRNAPMGAAEIVAELGGLLEADTSVELEAWWDLWVYDAAAGAWKEQPERLEIVLNGPEFDDGMWRGAGHFSVDLGFEHFFTGHAGLLGGSHAEGNAPLHPVEAEFLTRMAKPGAREEYVAHTRKNVAGLKRWAEGVARALPVEKFLLESEGEEDFESRIEEVAGAD